MRKVTADSATWATAVLLRAEADLLVETSFCPNCGHRPDPERRYLCNAALEEDGVGSTPVYCPFDERLAGLKYAAELVEGLLLFWALQDVIAKDGGA